MLTIKILYQKKSVYPDSDRPQNFFAHAIIMPEEWPLFRNLPPGERQNCDIVMLWRTG
jgi:hypothetical protein